MQIKEVNVSEIKEYARNAKKHPEKQVVAIATSIKKFGFRQPIVLDRNMEIVIGHGRFAAAKMLRMETVPCVLADDLTDEQIKALRIADNKTNESEWDFGLLGEELAQLVDIDMTDLGFNEAEILELQIDDSPEIPQYTPQAEAVRPVEQAESGEYVPVSPYNGQQGVFGGQAETPPYIPEEAAKEDLAAYAERATGLVTRRVIIIYRNDEEEKIVKDLLGVPQEEKLKVIYIASDIKAAEES